MPSGRPTFGLGGQVKVAEDLSNGTKAIGESGFGRGTPGSEHLRTNRFMRRQEVSFGMRLLGPRVRAPDVSLILGSFLN